MSAIAPSAFAQDKPDDFFAGKQINLALGFPPGGSNSIYAQVVARHMGRFLPGAPAINVQHMPGAGGLVAANFIANTAPRDGTAISLSNRTTGIEPLLGNTNAKFDGRRLSWLGTANVEYSTCLSWHTSPVKTLADAMARDITVGGTGPDATEVIFPKAANQLAGTRFKIVLGYPGSNDMTLAMERGELEGNCGLGWTLIKNRHPDWLAEKKINLLFQIATHKHPDLPDTPAIIDYAKTPEDKQVFEFLFAPQDMGRPFFAPPDLPPARLNALRDAFANTLSDRQFLADAEKSGVEIHYGSGEGVQALIEKLYQTPAHVIERVKDVAK